MVERLSTVRVVVVSGVRVLREGVAALLRDEHGLEASAARPGEATGRIAEACKRASREGVPDERVGAAPRASVAATRTLTSAIPGRAPSGQRVVALVDHLLPDLPSIVARLAARASVVVYGVPERDATVIACTEAGAVAYVPIDASRTELRNVVVAASKEDRPGNEEPSLVFLLMRRLAALSLSGNDATSGARGDQRVALTLREREVAQLLERGFNNTQIADRLGIAASTVRGHVHRLLEKMHGHRAGDATAQFRSWLSSILALPPLPADAPS